MHYRSDNSYLAVEYSMFITFNNRIQMKPNTAWNGIIIKTIWFKFLIDFLVMNSLQMFWLQQKEEK